MSYVLELAAQAIQVEVVDEGGFDWAAAGVGALGAIGLVLVVAGAALALRSGLRIRRHGRRTATTRSTRA